MWVIFARAPVPEQPVWPGRRLLAVIDAAAWPAVLAIGIVHMPWHSGLAGHFFISLCVTTAMRRVWRACLANHRYRFATVWVVATFAWLLATGALLKLAA